jgi:F-type H+-transporting ATPase subunit b
MPQMDFSTYPTQLFWLAVTFIALYGLMKWLALPRVAAAIEARRRRLDDDLGRAAQLRQEAEGVLAAYEKGLAAARAEAQAQLRQTAEKMAAEAAERQRRLGEALAAEIAAAERRIAASKEAALSDIRGIAGDVGRAMVEKLTGTAPDAGRMAAAVETALAGQRG